MKIKVLTLNLFLPGSNQLFLDSLDFLKKEKADIMLLQEVYDGRDLSLNEKFRKRQEVKRIFPEYFDVYMPVFTDTRKVEGEIADGQLVLSKFPLSEVKHVFIDKTHIKADHDVSDMGDFSAFPAGFLSCAAIVSSKKVKLINIHGPVNLDGEEDDFRRMRLLELLKNEIQTEEHIILGGDSNAQPSTKLYSQLEQFLQNPFQNKLETTFNLKRKDLKKYPGYKGVVVDMLMCSKNFKILSYYQPRVDISDHLPLVMKIEF